MATSSFGPIFVNDFSCAFMYQNCTSLMKAPNNLKALALKPHCYRNMFQGCSKLISAPILSFTTVPSDAEFCCYWMFVDCTSMSGGVHLRPVSSLPAYLGFVSMFSGCKKLTEITVHFTSWPSSITGWVSDVSDTGVFNCPEALGVEEKGENQIIRGDSHCPVGWKVVNNI
jgi:hypothetical protein